jgi:hypothetical protein
LRKSKTIICKGKKEGKCLANDRKKAVGIPQKNGEYHWQKGGFTAVQNRGIHLKKSFYWRNHLFELA